MQHKAIIQHHTPTHTLGIISLTVLSCLGFALLCPNIAAAQNVIVDEPPRSSDITVTSNPASTADDILRSVNQAINTFIDEDDAAYDFESQQYDYQAISRAAHAANENFKVAIKDLDAAEAETLIGDITRQISRLSRHMELIQFNANQKDNAGILDTVDGFFVTLSDYDAALSSYSNETGFEDADYVFEFEESWEFGPAIDIYLLAAWALFGVSIGATTWAIQKPRHLDTKKLRVLRHIISGAAWAAFICVAGGFAIYLFTWYEGIPYEAIAGAVATIVLIGLWVYYTIVKRRTLRHNRPQ